jgi:hypothetical protein
MGAGLSVDQSSAGGNFEHQLNFCDNGAGKLGAHSTIPVGNYSAGVQYEFLIGASKVAAGLFIRGGDYPNWTLLWVYPPSVRTKYYPAVGNHNSAFTLDTFRVLDLALYDARFASDYGLATSRLVSPAAGTTAT